MLNRTECERLAAMAHQLRPDWPVKSIATHVWTDHRQRAYRDVAVGLAWIATDPATLTPARLAEAGPWWVAVADPRAPKGDAIPRPGDERCEIHPYERAAYCRGCLSDAKAAKDELDDTDRAFLAQGVPRERIAQIRAEAGFPSTRPDVRSLAAGEGDWIHPTEGAPL